MTRVERLIGVAILALAVLLPLLALVPLGWAWLWERGYALYWLGGALLSSILAFGVWVVTIGRLEDRLGKSGPASEQARLGSPREIAAQEAVEQLARGVEPAKLTSRDAVLTLGVETVEAVARQMHPGEKHPIYTFTVPEALALIEQTSSRLRPLVSDAVPLGDRLTIAQMIELYRWRGVLDTAGKAYDVWRAIRLLNPTAAATQEIRERLSRMMLDGARDELAKRLAAAYVREVGHAAVDLYSGRLRLPDEEALRHVTAKTAADREHAPERAEPLRLLIAGQVSSGKSSLINALAEEVRSAVDALPTTREFTTYEVAREGMPGVALIDSPGIAMPADTIRLAERSADCDLLIWVVAANRADREVDRDGVAAVRAWFAERPERRAPSILVVLTHIDLARPFQEWSPPYDVAAPKRAKEVTIRAAMEAVAEDLAVPIVDIVPVCVAPQRSYNVDLVWAKLVDFLPVAQSAQLLRMVADARPKVSWHRLVGQAVAGGRLAAGLLAGGRD